MNQLRNLARFIISISAVCSYIKKSIILIAAAMCESNTWVLESVLSVVLINLIQDLIAIFVLCIVQYTIDSSYSMRGGKF